MFFISLTIGKLKMPNELILVNIIIILSTFIFLVLVGVIWLNLFLIYLKEKNQNIILKY